MNTDKKYIRHYPSILEFIENQYDGIPPSTIIKIGEKFYFKRCGHELIENNFYRYLNVYSRKIQIVCKLCHSAKASENTRRRRKLNGGSLTLINIPDDKNPVCEFCGNTSVVRDHKKGTNVFRGWLCTLCNVGLIGRIEKYNISIQKIVDYLNRVQ